MLGVILTSDANSEQARTDISRESTLSNCLDSYKLDDDIIKSEILRVKDFVIIQPDGSGKFERLFTHIGSYVSGIGRIQIKSPDPTILTVLYRNNVECIFGGKLFAEPMTMHEFLMRLAEVIKIKTSNNGIRKVSGFFTKIRILYVSGFFTKIGIFANLSGHNFMLSAVKRCVADPTLLQNISSRLYPAIAKEFNTTPSAVERGIRNAITVAFEKGKLNRTANNYYGANFGITEKPTNSEFIAYLTTFFLD